MDTVTVIGKYTLMTVDEPAMSVCRFVWREEDEDNIVLEWDWPAEPKVKLMLVFTLYETDAFPDIFRLLQTNHTHTVVSRDLSARFRVSLKETRQRFLICPAYFNEQKKVVVYQPTYITDWIYKKTRVQARVLYRKMWLGKFKKAYLSVSAPGDEMFGDMVLTQAIRYGIYENNRLTAAYPLDAGVRGSHRLYINENQTIKFILDMAYANLISLEEKQEHGKTYFFNRKEKGLLWLTKK